MSATPQDPNAVGAPPPSAPAALPSPPSPWTPRKGNTLQTLGWALLGLANPRAALALARGYVGGKMQQNAADQTAYQNYLPVYQRTVADAGRRADDARQLAEDTRWHNIQDTNRDAMTSLAGQNTRLRGILPLVTQYGQFTPEMDQYVENGGELPDLSGVKPRTGSQAYGRVTSAEGDIAGLLYKNYEANPTGGNYSAFQEALARAGQRPQVMQWDGSQALEFSPASTFQSRIDKHELAPYQLSDIASKSQISAADAKVKTNPAYIRAKVAEPGKINSLRDKQGNWLSLQPAFKTRELDQGAARIGESARHDLVSEGIAAGNLANSRVRTAIEQWKAHNPQAAKASSVGKLTTQLAGPDRNLLYAAHTFGANPETTAEAVEVIAKMADLERSGVWTFKRNSIGGITGVNVADEKQVRAALAPYVRQAGAKPAPVQKAGVKASASSKPVVWLPLN